MAGRVEQLRGIGSYLTYDIGDDAVIVIRVSEHGYKAFHNACQHRGRRILDAEGQVQEIACRFHGWRWHLNGTIKSVTERGDWANCSHMTDADIALKPVRVDTWGGWIFINLDEKAEPLARYLEPVAERCAPYEFEKLRARWIKTVTVKCNWKVAVEAFNEFYHVTATHAQLQRYQDDVSRCYSFGDHGMMSYPPELNRMWGSPAARTGMPIPTDYREAIVVAVDEFERTLKAIWSPRAVAATHRLMTELPADASPEVALGKMVEFWREAAIAEGAGWPDITPQQAADAGYDWHVFPNFIFLMGPDAAIFYRVRQRRRPRIMHLRHLVDGALRAGRRAAGGARSVCPLAGLRLSGIDHAQDFTNMEHVQHADEVPRLQCRAHQPVTGERTGEFSSGNSRLFVCVFVAKARIESEGP